MKNIILTAILSMLILGCEPRTTFSNHAGAASNYKNYCATCHGSDGRGDGEMAFGLPKKPTDFTDCALLGKISDNFLFRAIKEGGPGVNLSPVMPQWRNSLSDDEIKDLVAYIRSFCK